MSAGNDKEHSSGKKIEEAIDVVNIEEPKKYNLYEKREKIYTRAQTGFFQKVRLYTGWPLLLGYFLLPWLNLDGRQAVFFDLPARKFHILWLTFWPQDFVLLAWALIIAAFLLFFVTTWLGRVWCGYTCPQTVWTAIFMWAEQLTEGSRNQRISLDKAPWTARKIYRKTAKHIMWLGFAFVTGFTFIGYFYGIREMTVDLFNFEVATVGAAWITFFTLATYINAGWMREQVCTHMCPYARFQSAMFDKHTLIVAYDEKRGESRGPRRRAQDPKEMGLGDCIDCNLCVQVCPTGIDIRDGLQYQCINCALCIDACDDVMKKMNYEPGLISYTTEAKQEGGHTKMLRPKLIGYGLAAFIMVMAFSIALVSTDSMTLDVIRDRSALYVKRDDGMIQNNYTLKIANKDNNPHTMTVSVEGIRGLAIEKGQRIEVGPGEVLTLPVVVTIDPVRMQGMSADIEFTVVSQDNEQVQAVRKSRFFGPSGK